jgi:quinol monooxygenase YgiN
MKKLTTLVILCAAMALPACGGGDQKKDDKVAKADKKDAKKGDEKADAKKADDKAAAADDAKPADAAAGEPPFTHILFARHAVADYDAWKKVFDADQEGRAAAGLLQHWVYQDAADPNVVMVVGGAKDLTRVKEMMGSDEMKKKMEESGVKGPPELVLTGAIKASKPPPEGAEPAGHLFVLHEVEDFDKWLTAFNADDAKRAEASIISHGVVASDDNPNLVGIHVSYTDEAKVQAMMGSEEMKKVMADAGVKGEPTAYFAKMVEDKAYETAVAAK